MPASDRVDCVIIGAGVIGIAIARELALAGHDVIVLEAEAAIGTHTSSRNSEVIHAGLYYPPGSLKAALCVAGRDRLYAYCEQRHVPYRRTGKLIIASQAPDARKLEDIAAIASRNGVDDLQWLSAADIARREAVSVRHVIAIAAWRSWSGWHRGVVITRSPRRCAARDDKALRGSR